MAPRETLGRLVLLEETGASALGREFRAARLGPGGLERLVSIVRFEAAISSDAEVTARITEQARLASRALHPALVRVIGAARVEQSLCLTTELVEGRSLAAILERCRHEAFPFAADHALMIVSRAAAALESLRGSDRDPGPPSFHGLVAPSRLVVTFEGEVKLTGLGLWAALHGTGLLPDEERRYLAPEQRDGGLVGVRSDVYALGLVLLEALAGQAPDGSGASDGLAAARLTRPGGEQGPLPEPLVRLLRRALDEQPAARFEGAAAMRKAIDALLFSGDFAPTTFDLAFLMHTLFRDEMEREARAVEAARRADYGDLVPDDPPPAPPRPARPPAGTTASPRQLPESGDRSSPAGGLGPDASGARAAARASREAAARTAAARMTLGAAASPPRRGLWLALGLLAAVLVGGGGGYLYFVSRGPAPPASPPPAFPSESAQARVRELEARIAELEREKAEAEARAAEDARQTIEAEAAAGGAAADSSVVTRAQEDARRRVRGDQDRRQEDERRRLEGVRKVEAARPAAATPEPPPTPAPAAEPAPAPAEPAPTPAEPEAPPPPVEANAQPAPRTEAATPTAPAPLRPGALVELADAGVQPPVVLEQSKPHYPPAARVAGVEGTVELMALVDEDGRVGEVQVVRAKPARKGFEASAVEHVRSRRYRPATKEGIAVRVWVPIVVNFRMPRR
jgi:TonB family protein